MLLVVALSSGLGAPGKDESFAFRVFWPRPSQYLQGSPMPNAYLQINYTGPGERTYEYSIYDGPAVLAHGTVNVTGGFPCTIYVISPVPAVLQARVSAGGAQRYLGNLSLGG